MAKHEDPGTFKLILALIFLALLVWCLSGCRSTAEIGANAVSAYKASSQFAQDCNSKFPVVVTPGKVIEIPGPAMDCDSVMQVYRVYLDSLRNSKRGVVDSVVVNGKTVNTTIPPTSRPLCPPSKEVHDTIVPRAEIAYWQLRYEEMRVQHTKDTALLSQKYRERDLEATTYKSQRNRAYGFIGTAVAITGVILFRRPLFGMLAGLFRRRRR